MEAAGIEPAQGFDRAPARLATPNRQRARVRPVRLLNFLLTRERLDGYRLKLRPTRGEETLMKGSSPLASLIGGVVLLALVVTSSTGAGSSPSRLRLHQAASTS